jgi:hypothetical protein
MIDEQEIYAKYTPHVADLIVSYETAEARRQIEIISELVKDCIIYTLDGPFPRAFEQLRQEGWMSEGGEILKDISNLY